MSDRRDEIIAETAKRLGWSRGGDNTFIHECMDQRAKELCIELLEYMSINNVYVSRTFLDSNDAIFRFKGEWLTKEQLFENFL